MLLLLKLLKLTSLFVSTISITANPIRQEANVTPTAIRGNSFGFAVAVAKEFKDE
jgi:hypothetical protein